MFSESNIAKQLIQAYLDTHYRVQGDEPFELRIGQASIALRHLYQRHGCECAAYV